MLFPTPEALNQPEESFCHRCSGPKARRISETLRQASILSRQRKQDHRIDNDVAYKHSNDSGKKTWRVCRVVIDHHLNPPCDEGCDWQISSRVHIQG